MSKKIQIVLIIIAGCLTVGCRDSNKIKQQKVVAAANSRLLLQGVRIVDTYTGKISGSSDILIIGQKIINIGPSGSIPVTDSIKIINAYGKFIVPGFLDMHAHPMTSDDVIGSLALFLANGITGFRQMSGTDDLLEKRRKNILPIG